MKVSLINFVLLFFLLSNVTGFRPRLDQSQRLPWYNNVRTTRDAACATSRDCPQKEACIQNKCADPCLTQTCKNSKNCIVNNHIPICIHTDQDLLTLIQHSQCNATSCGYGAQCVHVGVTTACACPAGTTGNPYEECSQIAPCYSDNDCSYDKKCRNTRCIDPCETDCGILALCSVIDHVVHCSCPDGMAGDPTRQCLPKPNNPCNPNPCNGNEICYVTQGRAACTRIECSNDFECDNTKACSQRMCIDPCIGTCGIKALCYVQDHIPRCYCPNGMQGDPKQMCSSIQYQPQNPCYPNPCAPNHYCEVSNGRAVCSNQYLQCSDDSQCEIQKSCNQGTCQNVCHTNACGTNAICAAQNHRPMCYCPAGHNGNPMVECTRSGCQNDNQCQTDQLCRNNQCTNPCLSPNNICAQQSQDCVTMNHKIQCFKASCSDNNQCQHNQFCFSSNCADVCTFSRCGENTLCTIQRSHQATCICKPETYGNPVHGCFYQNRF